MIVMCSCSENLEVKLKAKRCLQTTTNYHYNDQIAFATLFLHLPHFKSRALKRFSCSIVKMNPDILKKYFIIQI